MNNFELYRHFDSNDALLYIGQSYSAFKRLTNGHKRTAHWYPNISRQEIERFPSKEALDEAEVRAIKKEKPLHNIQHNNAHTHLLSPILSPLMERRKKKDPCNVKYETPYRDLISTFGQLLVAVGGIEEFTAQCAKYIADREARVQLNEDSDSCVDMRFEDFIKVTGEPGWITNNTIGVSILRTIKFFSEKLCLGNTIPIYGTNYDKTRIAIKKAIYEIRPALKPDPEKEKLWRKNKCYPYLWSLN